MTHDRLMIGAAIVLTAVLFTARAADPVNIIKLTALVLVVILLLASGAVRTIRTRVLHIPWSAAAAAAGVLLAAFVVATVTAPVTTTAILGTYGRNSGLIAYGSALVLFLVALRVLDRGGTRVVLYALMVAGAFTASYGLLQYAGADPVNWNNPFNPIIASLGNPNFAAAYLAICTPAAAWGALRTGWGTGWRALSGVLAVLCLTTALLSNAAQGPLAAAPGLAVLAVAWLLDRRAQVRRVGLAAVAAATAAGLALLGAGVAGVGPAAGVFSDIGSRARGWYWQAALSLWRDNPVFGVGLDSFGSYWRAVRPLEATRTRGGNDFTDAAHSVPLQLLATGGAVLALAYAAFVGVVLVSLVLGLRRLRGQERLLLGALGGSWAAYQVQSLVSIDQVPLIVTQYVLAAAIVVAAGRSRLREIRLPGAPAPVAPPVQARGRKRRPPAVKPRPRALSTADHAALVAVAVVALALAWVALIPLRANAAALTGDVALAGSEPAAALDAYDHAIDLMPTEPRYWQKKAQLYERQEQGAWALQAWERAIEEDPFDVNSVRQTAIVAEQQGQIEKARQLHQRALELDPTGPRTVLAAAQFELRHEGAEKALSLLEQAVEVLPENADLWASLGDARAVLGDSAGARAAYERALELKPDNETATTGLAKLAESGAAA